MPHLPHSSDDKNSSLCDRPPENSGVRSFAGLSKTFLPESLVVLFFLDLLDLIEQLSHTKLKFSQFILRCDLRVIVRVLADKNVEVNTKFST